MKNLLLILVLLTSPLQAYSWGSLAHRSVGYIAESTLTPRAQIFVQDLLGAERIPDVASWADFVREAGQYRQTVWYHFEKIPDHLSYLENLSALPEWQQQKSGIVGAILVAYEILRQPGPVTQKKTDALKFLIHFVGDIHQPLHTGRPEDNGAVKIKIEWFGVPMSLHAAWDSGMIVTGYKELFKKATNNEQASLLYAQELVNRYHGNYVPLELNLDMWIKESMSYRTAAYEKSYETNQQRYQDLHLPQVDQRVYAAGVRLGSLINEIANAQPLPLTERTLWSKIEAIIGSLEKVVHFTP